MGTKITCARAPLWRRLAAMLYDMLLVSALFLIITAAYLLLEALIFGVDLISNPKFDPVFLVVLFAVIFLYFTVSWLRRGQTVGMLIWRIKIQSLNEAPLSLLQVLLRFVVAVPSVLLLGVGFIWLAIDKEKLSWYDRISGSEVVLMPTQKKQQSTYGAA